MNREDVDVLIVGAGPAGLFAALEVASRSDLRVAVIDAGEDIEGRGLSYYSEGLDNRVWGVGGAGMFSDGKLCLSLGVGGELGAILPWDRRQELLERVARRLGTTCAKHDVAPPPHCVAAADDVGLEFTYYPVLHVGSDHCAERIRLIRDAAVHAGAKIHPRTRLDRLERRADAFRATVVSGERYRTIAANRVVLAMGKVGAANQARICRSLGASVQTIPMYIGTRLETDRTIAAPLFREVVDPKYKLYFSDGSKLKMHCASDGGMVLPLAYDGFVLAGGHSLRDTKTSRSSFGLLWNGLHVGNDAIGQARALMKRSASIAPGALLAQRLVDCLDGKASTTVDIARAGPSTQTWIAGSLTDALPSEYFDRLSTFVERLDRMTPGLLEPSTLLFGPAIEWWMSRVSADSTLETDVDGLFVAGDGSGWSQGIVHAAATGTLVADAIVDDQREAMLVEATVVSTRA